MKKIRYRSLPTEKANPLSRALDRLPAEGVVGLMNREDRNVVAAVGRETRAIAAAAAVLARSLAAGKRIFFVGAGTSGRLGVLESAELPPTFGTSPRRAQAIMAGGKKAVFRSQEGAEDDAAKGREQVRGRVREGDAVVGIAASGVTPFVRAALAEARRRKAATILVTCNLRAPLKAWSQVVVAPDVGPEVIAGSTRLKSGTATKMVLNMMTTCAMVRLGKVFGNRMVDLQPKSRKLRERGIRLVQELAGLPRPRARRALAAAGWHVKAAVLMARKGWGLAAAKAALRRQGGMLSRCL